MSMAGRLTALAALGGLFSCAGSHPAAESDGGAALLATAVGPALQALWDGAGGIAAWRRVGSMRFVYEAQAGRAHGSAHGRLFGPEVISFDVGRPNAVLIGRGDAARAFFLDEEPVEDAADYLLRGIRVFAAFPFVLGEPGWEFRRHLVAGETARLRGGFWAVPAGAPSPHQSYYVDLDPENGALRAVYYQVGHPYGAGKVLKVVFGRYETVNGLRIATEITHYASEKLPRAEPRYPWESPPAPGEMGDLAAASHTADDRFVLRERIRSVELRLVDEADE